MQKINLRDLYPDIYKTDIFSEVTDEVQAVFLADKRAEAARKRQMYNYKAHYSLDCDNGIEKAVVQHPLTPEEILEDRQLRDQLYAAVMTLPDKQAKRIYARFYLGMTVKEIAQAEDVDLSRVYDSIQRGLKRLEKF
ncbi:MAG: sigma-70 family RNA polymerase sigma factor [Oscillospiraceae bacterium]|jgi:RNA polymerase sigma factor (sigma-70 family)